MRLSYLISLLTSVLISTAALGQSAPIKFGKVDEKDLKNTAFGSDTTAEAVVLCDYGRSRFEVNSEGDDFQVVFERVTRIKILKKSGYDWATVRVPLYHKGSREEKIVGLKGFTYNLVNGQVVKDKLASEGMFQEQSTPNITVRKFTLPNVREGSIIEYTYAVTSDFLFNFQDWQFQRAIPTRWSEYYVSIPKYFDYKIAMQGYEPLAVDEHNEGTIQVTLRQSAGFASNNMKSAPRVAAVAETVPVPVQIKRWVMKDVPAFRDEPYMTSSRDYVARVDFELAGIQMENQSYRPVADTWDKIDRDLLADESFGQQLKRGSVLKEQLVPALAAAGADPAARAAAVHALVRKAVRYNGNEWIYTSGPFRRTLEQRSGNSADVNLLLVAGLREAGLDANPVLLSTRDNGTVNEEFPLVSRFNYVVAHVALPAGKELLMDATEELLPHEMLPYRCLNQTGRIIMPKAEDSHWISLQAAQPFLEYQQVQLTLDERGAMKGKVHHEHGGYLAHQERVKLQKQGEKKYVEALAAQHEGWTLSTYAFKDRETFSRPLSLDYEFSAAGADASPENIYLVPLQYFGEKKHPFLYNDRRFPVNFGTQLNDAVLVTIQIPANYMVDELPKAAVVDLPNNGGRYSYAVLSSGNTLQLVSRMNLLRPVYAPEEYAVLQEFYTKMLAKQMERIVLKKKS